MCKWVKAQNHTFESFQNSDKDGLPIVGLCGAGGFGFGHNIFNSMSLDTNHQPDQQLHVRYGFCPRVRSQSMLESPGLAGFLGFEIFFSSRVLDSRVHVMYRTVDFSPKSDDIGSGVTTRLLATKALPHICTFSIVTRIKFKFDKGSLNLI